MNAIQLLRRMHGDTKVRFKVILATDNSPFADQQWRALQRALELHEELEDAFVYLPLQEEMGAGTPLGDWAVDHDTEVHFVAQLIKASDDLAPGSPEWRMCLGAIVDALSKHVMDEENQIFGQVEQVWDGARLEQLGAQMQERLDKPTQAKRTTKSTSTPAARRR